MNTNIDISQSDSTNCHFSTTNISSGAESTNFIAGVSESFSNSSYRKSYIAWDKLERANKPDNYTEKTKYLSKNAKALLSVVYQKLKRQNVLLLNHKYISTITGSGSRQNQRIIQEIKNIIEVSYKRGITELKGKKYKNCYEFRLKENSNCHHPSEKNVTNDISKKSIQWTKMSTKNTPSTYIDKNNIINNRSRANFVKNSFGSFSTKKNSDFESKNKNDKHANLEQLSEKPKDKNINKPKEDRSLSTPNTNGFLGSGKYLHEVLEHLTDEMCNIIRTKCGKDFTNRAIREIAKAVSRSKKGAKAFFYHIKGFIAYLAKILTFEKRDPVKISSTNYYITANQTDSEREMRKQENYLTDIEYSLEVSPEWHLKKKLAATLERSKAYNLLINWKAIEITKEGIAKLKLAKSLFLTETDKKIILSQVQATHDRVGGLRGDERENSEENIVFVESLELTMPEGDAAEKSNQEIHNSYRQTEEPSKREGVWGKIRETFASYFHNGDAIDKSWTAKLEAKIDGSSNTIELQAPSVFIRDWIKANYLSMIENAAKDNGIKLTEINVLK